VAALFAAVDARFAGVDILVNNAAHRAKAEFFDMTVEQWDRMQAVTLRGTFLCSREAVLRMKKAGRGGAIVNVSSVGSIRTTLWGVNMHYNAAKAGVVSLTRSLAISASYNIRGPITGQGRIPMGRTAHPMEVAQTILFLAGPATSYVTGQVIAADGGFSVS
jgi:NAD(P)-dependent dehydrogenase (short-subunit alcohol dehydrogenase family)